MHLCVLVVTYSNGYSENYYLQQVGRLLMSLLMSAHPWAILILRHNLRTIRRPTAANASSSILSQNIACKLGVKEVKAADLHTTIHIHSNLFTYIEATSNVHESTITIASNTSKFSVKCFRRNAIIFNTICK